MIFAIGMTDTAAAEALSATIPSGPASIRVVDWQGRQDSISTSAWSIESWGPLREASLSHLAARDNKSDSLQVHIESLDGKAPPAHLVHPVALIAGHIYRTSVEMSAAHDVTVEVMLRAKPAPFQAMGVRSQTLSPQWQTVTFNAAWPAPGVAGDFRVVVNAPDSRFLIRRLTIEDLGLLPLGTPVAAPFPAAMLGMHVNKLGQHSTWPAFQPGLIRLWDTHTNWHHLAPDLQTFDAQRGSSWQRLDLYVDYARGQGRNTPLVLTLGQPPSWASDNPNAKCAYGTGTCGGPKSLLLWRHYVRTLAERYKGRIQYWELWNEPDYEAFYQSSVSLVELAKAAREELKAVDKGNQLLSPGFTNYGIRALEGFLRDGGGQHVDVIAFHWYYGADPETLAPMIYNVRQLIKAYGASGKPLWNTEGSPHCEGRLQEHCVLGDLDDDEVDAVSTRAVMTMWLNGVDAFAYYFLEGMEGRTVSYLSDDFKSLSRAGLQLMRFRQWAVGSSAKAVSSCGLFCHVVELTRDGHSTYLIWAETRSQLIDLPAEWNVNQYQTLAGQRANVPVDRKLRVGRVPVFIS